MGGRWASLERGHGDGSGGLDMAGRERVTSKAAPTAWSFSFAFHASNTDLLATPRWVAIASSREREFCTITGLGHNMHDKTRALQGRLKEALGAFVKDEVRAKMDSVLERLADWTRIFGKGTAVSGDVRYSTGRDALYSTATLCDAVTGLWLSFKNGFHRTVGVQASRIEPSLASALFMEVYRFVSGQVVAYTIDDKSSVETAIKAKVDEHRSADAAARLADPPAHLFTPKPLLPDSLRDHWHKHRGHARKYVKDLKLHEDLADRVVGAEIALMRSGLPDEEMLWALQQGIVACLLGGSAGRGAATPSPTARAPAGDHTRCLREAGLCGAHGVGKYNISREVCSELAAQLSEYYPSLKVVQKLNHRFRSSANEGVNNLINTSQDEEYERKYLPKRVATSQDEEYERKVGAAYLDYHQNLYIESRADSIKACRLAGSP
eukprot:gene3619-4057_t